MKCFFSLASCAVVLATLLGCSSSPDSQTTNRAGRPITRGPQTINRFPLDTNTLYNACIKEREVSYCKNRLGR